MTREHASPSGPRRYWSIAAAILIAGVAGLALIAPAGVLHGYLCAFVILLGLPLGSGALMMLQWLIPGRWAPPLLPAFRAASGTAMLFVPLFVPLAIGAASLYPWAGGKGEPMHGGREVYLNLGFFLGRSAIYLIVWTLGGWLLSRGPRSPDGQAQNRPGVAAAGTIVYVLTMSFAAIDWVGSIEPGWYSSIFGLYLIVGQVLLALSFAISATLLDRPDDRDRTSLGDVRQDQGTVLLTFISLHAYMAFSQLLIIWNGNLPAEITWYVHRSRGVWAFVCVALFVAHFALPFVILLSRQRKRSREWLLFVCAVLIVMRAVELAWMIVPSSPSPWISLLSALIAVAGVGWLWMAFFQTLRRRMRDGAVRSNPGESVIAEGSA